MFLSVPKQRNPPRLHTGTLKYGGGSTFEVKKDRSRTQSFFLYTGSASLFVNLSRKQGSMFSQKAWRGTLEHGCRDQTGMATSVFAKGFFLPETSFNERLTAFFYQKNGFMSGSMSSAASLLLSSLPLVLSRTSAWRCSQQRAWFPLVRHVVAFDLLLFPAACW